MKRLFLYGLMVFAFTVTGCESSSTTESTTTVGSSATDSTSASGAPPATTEASACTGSGLDAMTALSDFQLEMDAAQKDGKLTVDQLTKARDTLFNQTQAAAEKEDWAAYCRAIDDMRTELGL